MARLESVLSKHPDHFLEVFVPSLMNDMYHGEKIGYSGEHSHTVARTLISPRNNPKAVTDYLMKVKLQHMKSGIIPLATTWILGVV